MAKFKNNFLANTDSTGFWVLFTTESYNQDYDKLDDIPRTGWDNRDYLLGTQTVVVGNQVECSFYPGQVLISDTSESNKYSIKSWYLIYEDDKKVKRIAVGLPSNIVEIAPYWDHQNVIRGKLQNPQYFTPQLFADTKVDRDKSWYNYLARDAGSYQDDERLMKELKSDMIVNGILNPIKYLMIE